MPEPVRKHVSLEIKALLRERPELRKKKRAHRHICTIDLSIKSNTLGLRPLSLVPDHDP